MAWKACKIALNEATLDETVPERPNADARTCQAIECIKHQPIGLGPVIIDEKLTRRCYVKLERLSKPLLPISTIDFVDEIKFNSQLLTRRTNREHNTKKVEFESPKIAGKYVRSCQLKKEDPSNERKVPKRKCATKHEPAAKKFALARNKQETPKTVRKYPKRKCTIKRNQQ